MATNTGKGYRRGAVKDRSQFQTSSGNWAKRDTETGRILDVSSKAFKGVSKER